LRLPSEFLNAINNAPGFDRESFVQVHEDPQAVTSVRVNPAKKTTAEKLFEQSSPVHWNSFGYYLPSRPSFTFDPSFHAGAYYVQEASSMFLEQALRQTSNLSLPLKVLDLCAAPGGKSTLIQSLISEYSLLVSNEVIKTRVRVLEENLVKWGGNNVVVTNNDPADFAVLKDFFDVIVIDAPCSGSGLFRRQPDAINEWSEKQVEICSLRQQRILTDVYPALKQNGILIYSTCSYSVEEDEQIADYLMDEFNLTSLPLDINKEWGIVQSQSTKHHAYGYRFYPDKLKGEGFFIACFRKNDGDFTTISARPKYERVSKQELSLIKPYLKESSNLFLWKLGNRLLAFPTHQQDALNVLMNKLYIKMAGVAIGKPMGDELVPDHSLALSNLVGEHIVAISLKKEEALQYLRREEVVISPMAHIGWTIAQYEGLNLGWMKLLKNRINNYYPKEWRILKSANN
jgi:16S rRNA C967 or C1407 C5-methylase (RsmB/RsmF family)/NOL1/NOP2/fmu family ribosome biogenesis protein